MGDKYLIWIWIYILCIQINTLNTNSINRLKCGIVTGVKTIN